MAVRLRNAGLAKTIEFRSQWSETAMIAHYQELTAAFRAGDAGSGVSTPLLGPGPVSITTSQAETICRGLWDTHRVYIKGGDTGLRASLATGQLFDLGKLIGKTMVKHGG
ncbi:hypothetical protein [Sulfobacillus harzensis]|uniref:Uncharacterized protein n=1 Tax=Sulfobacillus harzensis TaxID=2729629 RepID=A0A7Y0Q3I8_9FIRM|nr:hypothetical protein [Sulfobacillus harzensis]NMP24303.1 hypothetical protein [Sulfobacillus harzensis]